MHWRMSSFRMSSISSSSNSISSSPSSGCHLGTNRSGSNGSVSRAFARYSASCHGSKISLILATNAGIGPEVGVGLGSFEKVQELLADEVLHAFCVPNSSSIPCAASHCSIQIL